ncbi:MAG: hypothetical protein KKH52_01905, partial [Nanoarchaeota archaeon]|nr:hypothetical protein [Nanoarchaeota archaeon]
MDITPELAEIAGMHAGDGYLRYEGKRKEFDISGGYEEREYYDDYIIPLFNKLFGLSIKGKFFPSRGTYGFVVRKKYVLDKLKDLDFPSGKKTTIVAVPKIILESSNKLIISAFLRGYFDTDGCVTFSRKPRNASDFQQKYHYYPRIMFTTCSENLKNGFIILAEKLGFSYQWYLHKSKIKTENDRYKIQICGKGALLK